MAEGYGLSGIYNNYDSTAFRIIKAKYDYKLGDFKTEGIVNYFIYDKKANQIIGSCSSLEDEEFLAYYYKNAEGIDFDKLGIKTYDYSDLLNQSLDSLVSVLK